jgi:hypothetical protein
VTESKKEEMEDENIQKLATDTDKMDCTLIVVEEQTTEHSVPGNFQDSHRLCYVLINF